MSHDDPGTASSPHIAAVTQPPGVGEGLVVATGFDQILRDLIEDPQLYSLPARDMLHRLLTYGWCLPLDRGLNMLNDEERALLPLIGDQHISREAMHAPDGTVIVVIFYNTLGRLHLRPLNGPKPTYFPYAANVTIGYIAVPAFVWRAAHTQISDERDREAYLRSKVDALLAEIERCGELPALLDNVDDHVRHVEAVCFYADDELWGVIERCHSLIGDGGVFEQLRQKPVAEWTAAQRLGVAAIRALFLSGRSIRFEEFNGEVMTARRLFSRLKEMAVSYGGVIPQGDPPDLFVLAQAVGDAANQSVGKPWLRYRWNNGLTFVKTERLAETPESQEIDRAIPESLIAMYETWLGRTFDYSLGYTRVFGEMADIAMDGTVDHLVTLGPDNPAMSALEVLMQEVVTTVLFPTRSDYSMSSSLRDPSRLVTHDHAERCERMLALKPADFFTSVASRPGLRQELGAAIFRHVYGAVQGRMEFNRWHFVPGNFAGADVPRTRHFYYPPLTPDLTEWSDQRHGGHTRARIRYTVRAPGPDAHEPPLSIAGHAYRGFYDIRVVRAEGMPFTLQDLVVTRHHSLFMGAIWGRIIARCEQQPGSVKITGFLKGQGYEPAEAPVAYTGLIR